MLHPALLFDFFPHNSSDSDLADETSRSQGFTDCAVFKGHGKQMKNVNVYKITLFTRSNQIPFAV